MGKGMVGFGDPLNQPRIVYKVGVYGWRKRCLYLFILLLMVIVIVNLALTIWILKVMQFSLHGMGAMRVRPDSITVLGNSYFLESLSASHITSRSDSGLSLESARNITLTARNGSSVVNRMIIGDQKIQSYARIFEVKNPEGKVLFRTDSEQVYVGVDTLAMNGTGGTVFEGSIQTPLVRPESGNLRVESVTKRLEMSGPKELLLKAPTGSIDLRAGQHVEITSRLKSISLNSEEIRMPKLTPASGRFNGGQYPEVYQLCVCGNSGKLFLSRATGKCIATTDVCS